VRVHGVRIDVNYATLVMNALCLDGLAKALLPDYNVLDHAAALLRAHHRFAGGGGGLAASSLGQQLLKKVALPWAMAQKGRQDAATIRGLARKQPAA
jgi:aarF domain-containing kinase